VSGNDRDRELLFEQLSFFSEIGVTHLDLRGKPGDVIAEKEMAGESPLVERESVEQASPVSLETVREELGECARCKLHSGRTNIVFGVGNPDADLMFVGEAPGADEDAQGIPFVGRAGQLLTKIIEAIQLKREQVYIANILKCRPPGNRDPQPDEVAMCEPFLFRQIESVRPMIIVALGKYAAQTLLRTTEPISRLRGRFFEYRGGLLMPTFHPSYLLRNPSSKREVWIDMQQVRDTLKERGSRYFR
jgi:DNA polymerase